VLIAIAAKDGIRLRDIAMRVGITERAVQKILVDLESEGLVGRSREGRNNRYSLNLDKPLRHPIEAHRTVRELVELVIGRRSDGTTEMPEI
jgi:DNA-binding IclR family transcriptional regulator